MVFRNKYRAANTRPACAALSLLLGLALPLSVPVEAATFHEEWTASAVTCFAPEVDFPTSHITPSAAADAIFIA